MKQYLPQRKALGGKIKIKLDLKNVTGVDTSKFAKKVNLGNLKSDVDK